ncbi:MAG TPA: hypothetical protein VFS23_17030 [Vicinamibacterales bacterium]|nr:hypothetical protein [Vicinamibacterales bacterium]
MKKHLTGVVFAIGLLGVVGAPVLSAQVHDAARSSADKGGRIVHERLTAKAERSRLSMPGLDAWHLSASDQAAPQPAAKKQGGRKAMWILLGASAAIITATVMFAPGEAPIPATPSSNWRCTSFYRPGTLMTTSGYTCVSR